MLNPRSQDVRQFVRFAIVGLAQNGANLAIFALMVALGVPFILAAAIAAVVALAFSFVLNRRWTFPGTGDRTSGRAARFALVWLAFVAVALPTLALLVDVAHLPRVPAQALIIFVGAPLSYFIQRHWTFRATAPAGSAVPTPEPPIRPDTARMSAEYLPPPS
jgi:dolichol-phosphate mannosyltransferase